MNIKRWAAPPLDRNKAGELAARHGLSPFLAAMLELRGFSSAADLDALLGQGEIADPFLMKDMDRAVERIRRALDDFEKIAIYGDYDADGVTATAILYTYLQTLGADVRFYIPQREGEGYGMNRGAVQTLSREGVDLIITVDNGISAMEEIELANSLGMEVVVTDHHQPHETLPQAYAIVDAHQPGDESPFKDCSGAGVVLKLIIALEDGDASMVLEEFADLAAIGTVGDVVPLLGENRVIVQAGLEMMERFGEPEAAAQRPGLAALLELCGAKPTATGLAYSIVPCVNATGRMGAPERAVRLLVYEDPDSARSLAEEIREDNARRKQVEAEITAQAVEKIESDPGLRLARVIVVDGPGWHHGVVGIVAARVTERYGKPCFVISVDGEEARGSGRSVEGFSLFSAVTACQDLLTQYGGHPMAAGVTMNREHVAEFRRRINDYARKACPDMPSPILKLDCLLEPGDLSPALVRELEPLEPFGSGNPQPLFGLYGVELKALRAVGAAGNHTRLSCAKDGFRFEAVRFGAGPADFPFPAGAKVDLAVNLDIDCFRGEEKLSVIVRDVKLSGLDQDACIRSVRAYERFARREPLAPKEGRALTPNRDQLAAVYRLLQSHNGAWLSGEALLWNLRERRFNLGMILVCCDILEERGLIQYQVKGNALSARLIPVSQKVDIFASPLFARLNT